MVQCCGALLVGRGSLPVVAEGSAPDGEVEDYHHDVCDPDIDGGALDDQVLGQVLCQTPEEEQKTGFASPLNGAHALLYEQYRFRPPSTLVNLMRCQVDGMFRVDKIRANVQIDVKEHDEDGVETLPWSVRSPMGIQEYSYSEEQHQPVFGLELLDVLEV